MRGGRPCLGVLLCAAVVVAGCGGTPTAEGPASIVVGGTEQDGSGFTVLDGEDVTLIPGAQGGFHVWLKYRVAGMPAGPMRVRHSATLASDGRPVLVGQSRPVDLGAPDTAGAWQAPAAAPAFMCPAPVGVRIDGARIRFRVELLDAADHPVLSGQGEAVPHCPDGDQAAFCARICNG